jgi:hypothetical protein
LINLIDFDDFAASSNNPAQMPYSFDPFGAIQGQKSPSNVPQNNSPQSTNGGKF